MMPIFEGHARTSFILVYIYMTSVRSCALGNNVNRIVDSYNISVHFMTFSISFFRVINLYKQLHKFHNYLSTAFK